MSPLKQRPALGERCIVCGYDLVSTPDDAPCPECSTNTRFSRVAPLLRHSPEGFRQSLLSDLGLAAWGWGLAAGSVGIGSLGVLGASGTWMIALPCVWSAGVALWGFACARMTRAGPIGDERAATAIVGRAGIAAKWLGLALCISAPLLLISMGIDVASGAEINRALILASLLGLLFAGPVLFVTHFWVLGSLARRAGDPSLGAELPQQGVVLGVGAIVALGVAALLGLASPEAGFGVLLLAGLVGALFPLAAYARVAGAIRGVEQDELFAPSESALPSDGTGSSDKAAAYGPGRPHPDVPGSSGPASSADEP